MEQRKYKLLSSYKAHGKVALQISCPFCGKRSTYYSKDLEKDEGKECKCGAVHSKGITTKY
jgi:hypothetical protein